MSNKLKTKKSQVMEKKLLCERKLDNLGRYVSEYLLNDFGVEIPNLKFDIEQIQVDDQREFLKLIKVAEFPISTKDIGVMRHIIKRLMVTVHAGVWQRHDSWEATGIIEYRFSYDHSRGGSNGYTTTYEFKVGR